MAKDRERYHEEFGVGEMNVQNIINETNIYKLLKSTTIETGIKFTSMMMKLRLQVIRLIAQV